MDLDDLIRESTGDTDLQFRGTKECAFTVSTEKMLQKTAKYMFKDKAEYAREFLSLALSSSPSLIKVTANTRIFQIEDDGHGIPLETLDRAIAKMFLAQEEGDFYTALAMSIASAIGADGHSVTIESQPEGKQGYRLSVNSTWQTTITPGSFLRRGTRITVRKNRSGPPWGKTPEYQAVLEASRHIQAPLLLKKTLFSKRFTHKEDPFPKMRYKTTLRVKDIHLEVGLVEPRDAGLNTSLKPKTCTIYYQREGINRFEGTAEYKTRVFARANLSRQCFDTASALKEGYKEQVTTLVGTAIDDLMTLLIKDLHRKQTEGEKSLLGKMSQLLGGSPAERIYTFEAVHFHHLFTYLAHLAPSEYKRDWWGYQEIKKKHPSFALAAQLKLFDTLHGESFSLEDILTRVEHGETVQFWRRGVFPNKAKVPLFFSTYGLAGELLPRYLPKRGIKYYDVAWYRSSRARRVYHAASLPFMLTGFLLGGAYHGAQHLGRLAANGTQRLGGIVLDYAVEPAAILLYTTVLRPTGQGLAAGSRFLGASSQSLGRYLLYYPACSAGRGLKKAGDSTLRGSRILRTYAIYYPALGLYMARVRSWNWLRTDLPRLTRTGLRTSSQGLAYTSQKIGDVGTYLSESLPARILHTHAQAVTHWVRYGTTKTAESLGKTASYVGRKLREGVTDTGGGLRSGTLLAGHTVKEGVFSTGRELKDLTAATGESFITHTAAAGCSAKRRILSWGEYLATKTAPPRTYLHQKLSRGRLRIADFRRGLEERATQTAIRCAATASEVRGNLSDRLQNRLRPLGAKISLSVQYSTGLLGHLYNRLEDWKEKKQREHEERERLKEREREFRRQQERARALLSEPPQKPQPSATERLEHLLGDLVREYAPSQKNVSALADYEGRLPVKRLGELKGTFTEKYLAQNRHDAFLLTPQGQIYANASHPLIARLTYALRSHPELEEQTLFRHTVGAYLASQLGTKRVHHSYGLTFPTRDPQIPNYLDKLYRQIRDGIGSEVTSLYHQNSSAFFSRYRKLSEESKKKFLVHILSGEKRNPEADRLLAEDPESKGLLREASNDLLRRRGSTP